MEDARVLTVRQPWAAAIIHGGKSVENRTWQTRYRGRLWIHAGQKLEPAPGFASLPLQFGAIIGHVRLWDIAATLGELTEDERKWARPGQFFWRIADPVALDVPVPLRGLPGLQRAPLAVRARLPF